LCVDRAPDLRRSRIILMIVAFDGSVRRGVLRRSNEDKRYSENLGCCAAAVFMFAVFTRWSDVANQKFFNPLRYRDPEKEPVFLPAWGDEVYEMTKAVWGAIGLGQGSCSTELMGGADGVFLLFGRLLHARNSPELAMLMGLRGEQLAKARAAAEREDRTLTDLELSEAGVVEVPCAVDAAAAIAVWERHPIEGAWDESFRFWGCVLELWVRFKIRIVTFWTPSHAGCVVNEVVGYWGTTQSKAAGCTMRNMQAPDNETPLKCALTALKGVARYVWLKEVWEAREEGSTTNVLDEVKDFTSSTYKIAKEQKLGQEEQYALLRARLLELQDGSTIIGITAKKACPRCKFILQSARHLLFSCPGKGFEFATVRHQICSRVTVYGEDEQRPYFHKTARALILTIAKMKLLGADFSRLIAGEKEERPRNLPTDWKFSDADDEAACFAKECLEYEAANPKVNDMTEQNTDEDWDMFEGLHNNFNHT